MSTKRDYSNWSKDELVRELKKLEKRKKYGIVWEDKPEQVAELCKEKLPILEEERRKEIKTNGSSINVLVEGDNYHALSVLNYTHKGAVDIIYIDPPYNTGNGDSFKYNDKIVDREDAYRHSKWLSFMEKRLWLAKSLLKNTGVFFVSIGDDEFAQLKLLCDEVFDENNFLANIVRKSKETSNKGRYFSPSTDYVLCYAKNINALPEFNDSEAQKGEKYLRLFRHADKRGKYNLVSLYMPSLDPRPNQRYYIECPDGTKVITPSDDKMYRWIPATFKRNLEDDRVVFLKTKTSPLIDEKGNQAKWNIYTKIYLHERQDTGMKPLTFIDVPNSLGSKELIKMGIDFPFSKPKELIKFLISITNKDSNSIVLDFFAGSGTTGQAVLELNMIDNGNRKFILCTNDENNIATDICYPRLRKVIDGYKSAKGENVAGLGGNLKYFRTGFVNAEPTDVNKKKMVDKSTEMLCLKEDCFDELKKGRDFRIFTNGKNKHLGIVYDDDGIEPFKKEVEKLNRKFVVYVFSLDESAREEEFEGVEKLVELKPIPAVILNVYKRIFK